MISKEQLIEDYKVMIEADKKHLLEAVENNNREAAHRFVEAIVENQRNIEDLKNKS